MCRCGGRLDITIGQDHDIGCCAWHGKPCTCHLPTDERMRLAHDCSHSGESA